MVFAWHIMESWLLDTRDLKGARGFKQRRSDHRRPPTLQRRCWGCWGCKWPWGGHRTQMPWDVFPKHSEEWRDHCGTRGETRSTGRRQRHAGPETGFLDTTALPEQGTQVPWSFTWPLHKSSPEISLEQPDGVHKSPGLISGATKPTVSASHQTARCSGVRAGEGGLLGPGLRGTSGLQILLCRVGAGAAQVAREPAPGRRVRAARGRRLLLHVLCARGCLIFVGTVLYSNQIKTLAVKLGL